MYVFIIADTFQFYIIKVESLIPAEGSTISENDYLSFTKLTLKPYLQQEVLRTFN